jgi:hypothetical protein
MPMPQPSMKATSLPILESGISALEYDRRSKHFTYAWLSYCHHLVSNNLVQNTKTQISFAAATDDISPTLCKRSGYAFATEAPGHTESFIMSLFWCSFVSGIRSPPSHPSRGPDTASIWITVAEMHRSQAV